MVDIEGIGPTYAAKLSQAGIETVEALLDQGCTPAGRQHLIEATGLSAKRLMKWVNHADLFRIHGIAGQYAKLLEKAGVDTVVELAKRNAENLAKKMAQVNRHSKLVNKVPDAAVVAKWVEEAKVLPRKVSY